MWCPSVSLAVWGNAWLAGRAAPDDVLDALAVWTPTHAIAAHDAVAAGHTGLPSPGTDAGSMSLLATLGAAARDAPAVRLVLPVPGDVRGLPAGTPFQRDALDAGEAVIITGAPTVVGLVPEPEDAGLRWTAYALPTPTDPGCAPPTELATAEYELRSAVRSAVDALGSLGLAAAGTAEPRELVEQMLDDTFRHRVPDHAPARALRVLEQAAHVDAILAVAAGPAPIGTQSFSQTRISDTALRSLAGVVRTARLAAVDAILRSAWS